MNKKIMGKMVAGAASWQLRRFLAATKHPTVVQRQMLNRQLRLTANSKFASDHRLNQVTDYDDFAARVPIRRYEDFTDYIDPLKTGRLDSLFADTEQLMMFALTSGTTGQPKYIPVTRRFVNDYRRGWNVFGMRAMSDHPGSFFRRIVQITSTAHEQTTSAGIPCGAITGLLAATQKWIVRQCYVTPPAIAQISDPLAKSYTVARLAITRNVSFISTANPSTVLRLAQTISDESEQLIRDVHDGQLRPNGHIDHDVRAKLQSLLRPDRRSARRLQRARARAGRLLPKDIWQLEFLANWTGGTLKLYLSRFAEYFGDTPVRDIGLLASEGRFSIPIHDNTPAGILELTSNFFEFIPEDEYNTANPTVLTLENVKVGQRYFLVISNATGLTRYDLGDLVEVVDFYNRTPVIAFLSKGAHISSITGEKLSEHQVVDATAVLAKRLGQRIENFLVCPHWSDPPYYVLAIEHSVGTDRQDHIAQQYDAILQELNIEYKSKRQSMRLGPFTVRLVPDGYFARDDLRRLATAGRTEQYKRKFLLTSPDSDAQLPLTRQPR